MLYSKDEACLPVIGLIIGNISSVALFFNGMIRVSKSPEAPDLITIIPSCLVFWNNSNKAIIRNYAKAINLNSSEDKHSKPDLYPGLHLSRLLFFLLL